MAVPIKVYDYKSGKAEEFYPRLDPRNTSKQQLPMRRIKFKENGEVYQLRPNFVMPYMIGKTVALNGWSYHDNWLHNLLIASSMNGRRPVEKLATNKIR